MPLLKIKKPFLFSGRAIFIVQPHYSKENNKAGSIQDGVCGTCVMIDE
jgi:hypothetical protein